jgi:hypothetical protein
MTSIDFRGDPGKANERCERYKLGQLQRVADWTRKVSNLVNIGNA